MLEFENNLINGLKCFEVKVSWHHHGTNVRPTVEASVAYLTKGKPAGMATTSEFSADVLDKAQQLFEAIESEFLQGIGGDPGESVTKDVSRENIKGLVSGEI